jgi:hypothetical protein
MPIPVAVPVALNIGSKLLGRSKRKKARAKLRRANVLARSNRAMQALQARRAFRRRGRLAIAQSIVAGASVGADTVTSASRASQQSLQTQIGVGVSEQAETFRRNEEILALTAGANEALGRARDIEGIAGAAAAGLAEFT